MRIMLNAEKITLTFPSPIGELHFSIMTGGTMGVEFVMFPSPIGELHFSMKLYLDNCHIYITFPSPIGELHFSIFSLNSTKLFPQRFPSPIGELHFSMLQLMLHHRNTQSFRPLSGSYISQYFISCVCLLFIFVSVPYRGATFLNCNNKKAWSWHAGERFPSPIGELHFSIPSPQPHVLSGTNRGIAGEK